MRKIFLLLFILGILFLSGIALGRIGGGDIVFTPQKAEPVTFSHDFHVEDLGLTCQKCHAPVCT